MNRSGNYAEDRLSFVNRLLASTAAVPRDAKSVQLPAIIARRTLTEYATRPLRRGGGRGEARRGEARRGEEKITPAEGNPPPRRCLRRQVRREAARGSSFQRLCFDIGRSFGDLDRSSPVIEPDFRRSVASSSRRGGARIPDASRRVIRDLRR